ncbi:MAG: cytochrome c biogenesis protein CcsA [Gemmatimonadetes bacterium]|nr:cytochrome c biogenesis protein CcsA [Gemmatimonadota bacterium]
MPGSFVPAVVSRRRYQILGIIALAALVGAELLGLSASPPDRDMGHLQKIMYVHVPAAWSAFLAFFVVFIGSVLYLWKREERYDLLAAAAAEVALVLTALTLALGSIWGRPTWGVWWTWDPRLTTTAILLVMTVGYLALRSFVDEPDRRARWSAAVGILASLNVLVVYKSVQWWRTLHQVQSSPSTVDPAYALGLRLNALAFLLVLVYFILLRYRAARLERLVEAQAEARELAQGEELHV